MDTSKIIGKQLFEGVVLKNLARDENKNFQIDIVEIAPNSTIPEHIHMDTEWLYVLDGSFFDEYGNYKKGDFIEFKKDSKHTAKGTKEGCTILRCWCGEVTLT